MRERVNLIGAVSWCVRARPRHAGAGHGGRCSALAVVDSLQATADRSVASVQRSLVLFAIHHCGDQERKQLRLPRVTSAGVSGCLSDRARLRLRPPGWSPWFPATVLARCRMDEDVDQTDAAQISLGSAAASARPLTAGAAQCWALTDHRGPHRPQARPTPWNGADLPARSALRSSVLHRPN